VKDPGVRGCFDQMSRQQSFLDVESALAQTQAALGMIPQEAADRIAQVAHLDQLEQARIDQSTAKTSHPLVPLIWELARVAGPGAGDYVHWGATTQNIVSTGEALILRRVHGVFLDLIARILTTLADLADRSADMPVAGRTHGQHAVPMTFGYKPAVWIDELRRHVDRLTAAESRVFVAVLGGAVGNFASTGEQGPAVQAGVASRLGLSQVGVPSRSALDGDAEYVSLLGLLAATTGKIAREIYTLMKTEFGEVEEPTPPGTVGSSTMPQKRNPKLCQDIITSSARIRSCVPLALEGMQVEHESDRAMTMMIRQAIEEACVETGDALSRLVTVLEGLEIFPQRMRVNLDLTGGLIMSEAIMMRLAESLGRQDSHDAIYDAAQATALGQGSFADLLLADDRVGSRLTAEEVAALTDPSSYVGLSADIAHAAAEAGRSAAATISRRLAGASNGG
jgi:adenylosuccinate lyase